MKKFYLKKLVVLFLLSLATTLVFADPTAFVVGKPLPKWAPHYLDIDHLNEGANSDTKCNLIVQ